MARDDLTDGAIRRGEPPYRSDPSVEADMSDKAVPEQCAPRWNWISIGAPFVGYLAGILAGVVWEEVLGWPRIGEPINLLALVIWAVFCIIGLAAAGIALFRRERLWGLTATGIVLNAPLVIISLFFGLAVFFG